MFGVTTRCRTGVGKADPPLLNNLLGGSPFAGAARVSGGIAGSEHILLQRNGATESAIVLDGPMVFITDLFTVPLNAGIGFGVGGLVEALFACPEDS
jgi:hypothetical protein